MFSTAPPINLGTFQNHDQFVSTCMILLFESVEFEPTYQTCAPFDGTREVNQVVPGMSLKTGPPSKFTRPFRFPPAEGRAA